MADFLPLKTVLTSFVNEWNIYTISSLVCGVVLLIVLIRKSRAASASESPASSTSRCTSPSCARCHGETEIQKKLLQRLQEHVRDNSSAEFQDVDAYLSQNYARILSTVDSYDRKTEILSSIYQESGHGDVSTKYLAHVWMMPGLTRSPLWSAGDHAVMANLFSVFENPENFERVLQEYKSVSSMEDRWKINSIPTGSWKTYFLMNQGTWLQENSSRCPQTLHLLESTGWLMRGTVFGNAMFSSLGPGSQIEPHTSPCNFRLRCHLALNASTGFSLQVGKCTATWTMGQLLVFDDSFVHSVSHDAHGESVEEDRVVLIFDIWHPDIDDSERQALKYLFE